MPRKMQCVICGDKGVGKNYGAVTCEPCKVFFRRNTLENKKQKCRFGGNCFIDIKSRKQCMSCRMKKCIQMGMKKEFVINHNPNDSENTDISDSISDTTNSLSNDTTGCLSNDTFDEIIGDKQSNEVAIYTPINSNSSNNSIQKYGTNNIDDMFVKLSFSPVFSNLGDYKGFSDLETSRLTEVVVSSQVFNYKLNYNPKDVCELTNLVEINKLCIKMMERDVEDLISLTKNINSFNNLCFNDQLALIKYGCIEILLLRYSILYNINTDYWTMAYKADNKTIKIFGFKLIISKNVKPYIYVFYKELFTIINIDFNRDCVILDLLTAILLFDPNRPNLIHRDVVKAEQQLYIYLLQRYLNLKYRSKAESQTKWTKLMKTLINLQIFYKHNKTSPEVYLDSFGPLLKEMISDVTTV